MQVDNVTAVEREAFHIEVDDAPTMAVNDFPIKDAEGSTLSSSIAIEDAMMDEVKKKAIKDEVAR